MLSPERLADNLRIYERITRAYTAGNYPRNYSNFFVNDYVLSERELAALIEYRRFAPYPTSTCISIYRNLDHFITSPAFALWLVRVSPSVVRRNLGPAFERLAPRQQLLLTYPVPVVPVLPVHVLSSGIMADANAVAAAAAPPVVIPTFDNSSAWHHVVKSTTYIPDDTLFVANDAPAAVAAMGDIRADKVAKSMLTGDRSRLNSRDLINLNSGLTSYTCLPLSCLITALFLLTS